MPSTARDSRSPESGAAAKLSDDADLWDGSLDRAHLREAPLVLRRACVGASGIPG
jgi:hypothetical protein